MKRNILFAIIISLLFNAACSKKEKSVKPIKRNLTEAVYASGNIYPKNEYLVFANADGLLNRIFV